MNTLRPPVRHRLLFTLLALIATFAARGEVTVVQITPRDTDAKIGAAHNQPHYVYVDRAIVVDHRNGAAQDRRKLLLFLPGTGGTGRGGAALCELAAQNGYHAIALTYPTDVAAAEVCRNDRDPAAFETFRQALIRGGTFKDMTVSRADGIENRLAKLLAFLAERRPREGWAQFLTPTGEIKWSALVVSGQSQGGGHAALIAMKHEVARVLCFGSPKDFSRSLGAPAAWYREPSVTPKNRFFAFNHVADRQGCSPAELLKNVAALGLDQFGPPVDVASARPPYGHTRILLTSVPATTESKVAHGSVINPMRARELAPVWTYMLTEPVENGERHPAASGGDGVRGPTGAPGRAQP